jgi:hypothetical protein
MFLDGSAPFDRKEHNDFTRTKSRRSLILQQNKFRESRNYHKGGRRPNCVAPRHAQVRTS